ncbi:MAG: phycobilisome linker polypeptide [Cyanobacteria bacterium P01_A01_bin.3]
MNVSSGQGTGSYGNRTVAIEVSGLCDMGITRTSNYTIKVPFSRMSQTMQTINRSGAKVIGVTVPGAQAVAEEPA